MSVLFPHLPTTHIFHYTCVECSASPDNIVWIGKNNGANSIIVAEDTSNHQNDYAWLIDLNTGERTRILTSVYGAEVTGVRLIVLIVYHIFRFSLMLTLNLLFPLDRSVSMNMKAAVS